MPGPCRLSGSPTCSRLRERAERASRAAAFFLLVSLPALLAAQRDFPLGKDGRDFQENLSAFMLSDPNIGKEESEQVRAWLPAYMAYYGSLPQAEQEKVAEMARLGHKARLQPFPELFDFFQTARKMQEEHASSYHAWMGSLRKSLKKRRPKQFNDLVGHTLDLLRDGCLYRGTAARWQAEPSGSFTFEDKAAGPAFYFRETDLVCRSAQDSMRLYAVSGFYYPVEDRFEGQGGTVYWIRAGLSPDSCHTRLENFSINLRQGRYQAEGAVHSNLYLFPRSLTGTFSDRLTAGNQRLKNLYPRFASQGESLSIAGIFEDMDLSGPFAQTGNRIHFGSEGMPAVLQVREGNLLRGRFVSNRFQVERGRIGSSQARFALYLEGDSLYSPSVSMRYEASGRVFHIGEAQGTGLSVPFIDTYHRLRMELEAMRWHVGRGEVEIGLLEIPGRVGTVSFKSLDLYSPRELGIMMQGMEQNPLYLLASFAKRKKSNTLDIDALARMLGSSSTQALALLHPLIAYGYVSYDPAGKEVELLPQLFHALDVTAGDADFDEIEFKTTEEGIVKAVMRLDSLDIRMEGVPFVRLSSKQDVYAMPADSVVHIYKNRDFHFDGYFHAGIFNYRIRGGRFYYDRFQVDIADVQQLGLEVARMEEGELRKHAVESVIRSLSGTVCIDDPGNKGGRKDYPEYPIFESKQPAYVYYDTPRIQQGAYAADSFYFEVDPFRMEKLNTIQADSIRFAGTLKSYGLFPDIREHLVVRPDYSLGFVAVAPDGGWAVYDANAAFAGELSLDNGGLQGNGDFSYMGSVARSGRFVFLPHGMNAAVRAFSFSDSLSRAGGFPSARAAGVRADFSRRPPLFTLSSVKDSLLHFYREDWELEGSYSFSPGFSRARGVFRNQGRFRLQSSGFDLAPRSFRADTVHFRIHAGDLPLLDTRQHALSLDLDADRGAFRSLDGRSPVELPANGYEGRVARLDWDMQACKVYMRHEGDSASMAAMLDTMPAAGLFTASLPGEEFRSVRRAQAGLSFHATSSVFSYSDTLLEFGGVRRLLVADALFVPGQGRVEISRTGQMLPLRGARLYFGDRKRLHAFHGVSADILSSKQYRAAGLFDYKAPGLEAQSILFTGIRPLREGYSQASTTILADSGVLALNEAFQFIGKIGLNARQAYPFFSGSVRMTYQCSAGNDGQEDYAPPSWQGEPENGREDAGYDDFEYDDFEYEAEPGESAPDASGQDAPLAQEAIASSESGSSYGDFEYEEGEPDGFGDAAPRKGSSRPGRKSRKKDPDAPLPSEEAWQLPEGNPFLSGGIQFQAFINPDSVRIPVSAATRSTAGRLLGCGFYTQARSRQPLFLFMERKISTDIPNIAVSGNLEFSSADRSYRVVDSTGKGVLELRLGSCFGLASGEINPALNTYEMGIRFFGQMSRHGSSGQISVRAMGIFDFFLGEETGRRLASLLNASDYGGVSDADRQKNVRAYLREHLPEKEQEKWEEDYALTGTLSRIPDCLGQSLVFSDMEFAWDPDRKAFFSQGEAELLAVAGNPVNKPFRTMASLRKTPKGDIVDIYLEASSSLWVYFSYTNHYLQIITSDEDFNQYLSSLKGRARKKGRYEFYLSTLSKRNTFVGSFLNLQEEYR